MSRADPVRTRPPDPTGAAAGVASDAAALLLDLDPVLGEHTAQAAVDAFVEQAARSLQALARCAEVP